MALQELQDFITDGPVGKSLPVNLYWEPDHSSGTPILASTPGLVSATNMSNGRIRNMLAFNDVLYGVSGGALYSWPGTGSPTLQGSGINQTATAYWVSMAINYDPGGDYEIAITDQSTAAIWYYLIDSDTYSSIATPSGITPTNVTYLKQVFAIGEKGGNRVYCSDADDVTTWNALNFSSKTARPDRVIGVMAVNEDLWVFGETSSEIWYYTGAGTGLPFALMGGGVLDVGCLSIGSVATMDKSVYWLNNRAEVCRSAGYAYEVISPPIINDLLQTYYATSTAYLTNAIGYTIVWKGHPWYVLTLPSLGRSYVFDAVARGAGQRGWFQWSSASAGGRHYSNCAAQLKGDWVVGGYSGGNIYTVSDTVFTDNGSNNYRIKSGSAMHGGGSLLRWHKFIAQGSFPASGSGYYLQLGGVTNINAPSLTSPVRWAGLGSGASITPKLTYYGAGEVTIEKVFADVSIR